MRCRASACAFVYLLALAAFQSLGGMALCQDKKSSVVAGDPPSIQVTPCDAEIPIRIELVPVNEPTAGGTARFQVRVDSRLDPDLVQEMKVEYIVPARLRLLSRTFGAEIVLPRSGRSELAMEVVVPDETRYAVRARLVVRLTNGQTISQTAVGFIDLGEEDPPEGMIQRIATPDGTGIRVYQGATVRN